MAPVPPLNLHRLEARCHPRTRTTVPGDVLSRRLLAGPETDRQQHAEAPDGLPDSKRSPPRDSHESLPSIHSTRPHAAVQVYTPDSPLSSLSSASETQTLVPSLAGWRCGLVLSATMARMTTWPSGPTAAERCRTPIDHFPRIGGNCRFGRIRAWGQFAFAGSRKEPGGRCTSSCWPRSTSKLA